MWGLNWADGASDQPQLTKDHILNGCSNLFFMLLCLIAASAVYRWSILKLRLYWTLCLSNIHI